MRAIFGLVELDGGAVLWDGRPIGPAERLRFGYMPEERGLYPRMRVGEQLAYFGRLHGLDDARRARRGSGWLERLGPRRARRREGRGALARQPAARAARGGARARRRSCSSSTSRSRASTRSRCERSPRCCAARRPAAPPSSSPATSSSSSRTSARTSRSSTAAAIVADGRRRRAETRLAAAADRARARGRAAGVATGIRGRRRWSSAATATSACWPIATSIPEQVLAAAERSAQVVAFSYGPPSLAELFLELVAR